MVFGLAIAIGHDNEVRAFRIEQSQAAVRLVGSRIAALIDEVAAAGSVALGDGQAGCRAVTVRPGLAILGVRDPAGRPPRCDPAGAPGPDTAAEWRLVHGGGDGTPAVWIDPSRPRTVPVLFAVTTGGASVAAAGVAAPGAAPAALVAVDRDVLAASLTGGIRPRAFAGTALLGGGGQVLATTDAEGWPIAERTAADGPGAPSAVVRGLDGTPYRYFRAPVAGSGLAVVSAYAETEYLADQRQRLAALIVLSLAIVALVLLAATWAIDRSVIGWLGYLRRTAFPDGRLRPGTATARPPRTPPEIAELGEIVNRLADSAAGHARSVTQALSARDASLRELHHRVKNNFQVIASLLSLHKRVLPPERRDDIRFLEEHVQSMAVAYRVVYATGDMARVRINELVVEIVRGLRQTAAAPASVVDLRLDPHDEEIGLDQAIAVGLYFAVVLPPYLDRALASSAAVRIVMTPQEGGRTRLTIDGDWGRPVEMDSLRRRLKRAYVSQLHAEPDAPDQATGEAINFRLAAPVS